MAFEILPPSEQVARHMRTLILKGHWREHLPGTPALSQETGIDRKTITAAIKLLEEQGLVQSQGPGRARKIVLSKGAKATSRGLTICFIPYEERDRNDHLATMLQRRLRTAGHTVKVTHRTMRSMHMDLKKVIRCVADNPADVWIPFAASQEILQWMATQPFATMALFGRRREVDIAAVGPDKTTAMRELTEEFIALGHKRIVLFAREERRHPTPGLNERIFLETLESHGITSSPYNLPEWTSNGEGFANCLNELFRFTPPTAMIVEESQFFFTALQQLARRGLSAPEHVSIACTDDDLLFQYSQPRVTCIHWKLAPVVDHIVKWVRRVSQGRISRKQKLTPIQIITGGTIGPVFVESSR